MNNEHFYEVFVKCFMNLFSDTMNTMKAFSVRIDAFMLTSLRSFLLIYLKVDRYLETVHSVHLLKESVHFSVHKVSIKCSCFGGF